VNYVTKKDAILNRRPFS